jgi:PIN domain nuclease of toxin-antitoxin system
MIVLDAYALVAYLRGEAAAEEVADLLRSPTLISPVNAAEVVDHLVRIHEFGADDVHADLASLEDAGMKFAPVSAEIAISAGRLRARHYHRGRMALSLADCVTAATALSNERALATADPALATLLRAEGGEVVPLPDSSGRRP